MFSVMFWRAAGQGCDRFGSVISLAVLALATVPLCERIVATAKTANNVRFS